MLPGQAFPSCAGVFCCRFTVLMTVDVFTVLVEMRKEYPSHAFDSIQRIPTKQTTCWSPPVSALLCFSKSPGFPMLKLKCRIHFRSEWTKMSKFSRSRLTFLLVQKRSNVKILPCFTCAKMFKCPNFTIFTCQKRSNVQMLPFLTCAKTFKRPNFTLFTYSKTFKRPNFILFNFAKTFKCPNLSLPCDRFHVRISRPGCPHFLWSLLLEMSCVQNSRSGFEYISSS